MSRPVGAESSPCRILKPSGRGDTLIGTAGRDGYERRVAGFAKCAKLDNARENAAETRLFANEILQGAEHLSVAARDYMRTVTSEKARVIDTWAAAGKIEKIDARHLFILLWSVTQFYAEFEALACDALNVSELKATDYDMAAKTITQTVLRGLRPRHHDDSAKAR